MTESQKTGRYSRICVIPLKDKDGKINGVLDIDSKELNSFDETDATWLEKIVQIITNN